MNVTLPPPLDIYVSAEASTDVARLVDCFASDAVVRDEGRTITGSGSLGSHLSYTVDSDSRC
jgi:hypothetical protein